MNLLRIIQLSISQPVRISYHCSAKNVKRLETTDLKLSIKFSNNSSFDPPVSEDLPFCLQAHTGELH